MTYEADGDAQHLHNVIISHFPVLDSCGGYTLMRLKESSRNLIPIDSPDRGMTIPFLKDILRQAKLFVCPLQCDISAEEAEKYCCTKEDTYVSVEHTARTVPCITL